MFDRRRKKNTPSWINYVIASSLVILLLVGPTACQKRAPEPPRPLPAEPPRPQFLEHTVRYQGETLGIIAKWYTGNAANWKVIASVNPGLRPDRIRLGQVIQIPRELVIQDTPLPQARVRGLAAETRATAKQIEQSVAKPAAKPVSKQDSTTPRSLDDELKELEEIGASIESSKGASVNSGDLGSPQVAPTVGAASTGSAVSTEMPAPVASPSQREPASTDDAERERLLDELLQQQ